MVSKILAAVFAVAVLSVGGYTYWHYSGSCCDTQPSANVPNTTEVPPCCQELSRTSCFSLPPREGCCEDINLNSAGTPEFLAIQPREVK
jgi:hypothetical protein